jgi:hypothetical protein
VSDTGPNETTWRPPYMSYETLVNFFDKKIGDNPVPPRIDTQFLDNYAGSVRPLLVATLKTLGMLDDNSQVLEPLRQAVHGPDGRKAVLRSWAEPFYAEQIALGKRHATAQMLWETFSKQGGLHGSTLRRAVIFYLALAKDIGLPVSAHFKSPKAPPANQKPPRTPPAAGAPAESGALTPLKEVPDSSADGRAPEIRDISLGAAGSVKVIVKVRWLDLPDDQFTKLRKLIKDIEALEHAGPDGDDEVEDAP